MAANQSRLQQQPQQVQEAALACSSCGKLQLLLVTRRSQRLLQANKAG
jgi:hypothetical protein